MFYDCYFSWKVSMAWREFPVSVKKGIREVAAGVPLMLWILEWNATRAIQRACISFTLSLVVFRITWEKQKKSTVQLPVSVPVFDNRQLELVPSSKWGMVWVSLSMFDLAMNVGPNLILWWTPWKWTRSLSNNIITFLVLDYARWWTKYHVINNR